MHSETIPGELLQQIRQATADREVLLIADTPTPPIPDWDACHISSQHALQETASQYAIGLVLTPWVDDTQLDAVIASLRDLLVKELWVLHPGDMAEQTERMGALGLRCKHVVDVEGQSWGVNHFDLRRYKKTPHWLNSRYWANPELWNRFRW